VTFLPDWVQFPFQPLVKRLVACVRIVNVQAVIARAEVRDRVPVTNQAPQSDWIVYATSSAVADAGRGGCHDAQARANPAALQEERRQAREWPVAFDESGEPFTVLKTSEGGKAF